MANHAHAATITAPLVGQGFSEQPLEAQRMARVRAVTLAAIAALAVLNLADVATTHMLLAHRAFEANPLAALLLSSQSLLWVKLAIIGVLFVKVLRGRPRLGLMGAACFAAGIYATAVLSNLLVLHAAMAA